LFNAVSKTCFHCFSGLWFCFDCDFTSCFPVLTLIILW